MAAPVVDVPDVVASPVGWVVGGDGSVTVVYAVLVTGGGGSSGVEELCGGGLEVLDVGGGSSELVDAGGGELVVDGGGGSSEVDDGGGGGGSCTELVVGGGGGASDVVSGGSGADGVDDGTSSPALVSFDIANLWRLSRGKFLQATARPTMAAKLDSTGASAQATARFGYGAERGV